MTTLIEKVAELRELATKDIPGKYTSNCPEHDYIVGMLNAVPGMLDALEKIRAGDMVDIDWIIKNYGFTLRDHIDVLHRFRDLARVMERPLNDIQCAESPRAASPGGEAMSQPFDEDDAARILGIIEKYLLDCDCPECRKDVALMMRFQDAVVAASRPAWEVTEERKVGLEFAIELMELPSQYDSESRKKEGYRGVLRAMLEDAGP